jgi:transposase
LEAPKIKRILELRESKLSMNEIAMLAKVSKGSVNNVLKKAAEMTVRGVTATDLANEDLLKQFYPPTPSKEKSTSEPDFDALKEELSDPTVNAQLLWDEYIEQNSDGMSRTTFYDRLSKAGPGSTPNPSMHQVAKGGDRLLLDYSGVTSSYIDEKGKEVKAEIFVASWAASSYLYVEASHTQRMEDWVASNVRALRYFGCAPTYLVPDNLKSGVIESDFYDPTINRAYSEMAEHYGSAVLPARAYRPQDKAGVESNVRFIQHHILGRLRKRVFRSLAELNEAIHDLLTTINDRPMQRYHRSRRQRFEKMDLPYTAELPNDDFQVSEIKDNVKVEEDHHVRFRDHFYSVPWSLTGSRVDLWYGEGVLQIYHDGERKACHKTSLEVGGYTTNDQHCPPNHLFVRRLSPLWVLSQAEKIGPETHSIIRRLIEANPSHSEVAVRKGLGIVELTRDFSPEQVEAATVWAFDHGQNRLKDIRIVLEQQLADGCEPPPKRSTNSSINHDNIRGVDHYTQFSTTSNKEDTA